MSPKSKRSTMSDTHKAALAEGRREGHAVRAYLEALESHRPKRGRKRTAESVTRRLGAIDAALPGAEPLTRVQLTQERIDLTAELATLTASVDLAALEDDFVAALGPYSRRKGISYAAWRAVGIEPALLKRAGISRTS